MASLASEILAISRLATAEAASGARLATLVDPRPSSLSILIPGYTSMVDAVAADVFELMPLQTGDVVVALPR